ncbi:hypothetical protein D3C73_1500060 [compost metagenome]
MQGVVDNHDGSRRQHGIDRVVAGVGGAAAGVAGHVGDTGIVQGDDVARVTHADGWREGRGPGDTAVTAADGCQRAVGNGQVGVGETADRFTEGNRYQ